MSYSIVMLERRIVALERMPSAQKPLVIRGGLPRDYVPPVAFPKMVSVSVTKEPKANE